MIRDRRNALHQLFKSPGFTLTVVVTLAVGTIAMELADPQLRQELLNAQVALNFVDYQSLQAQPQNTLKKEQTSVVQVNADDMQEQVQAQTDKEPYDVGPISGFRHQQSKNIADQFSRQYQLNQQAAIHIHSGTIPDSVTRVDPSIATTYRTRAIVVDLNDALPPAIPQLRVNGAIDLKHIGPATLSNENFSLNLFKGDGKRATRISVNVGRVPANKIQVLHMLDGKAANKRKIKTEEAVAVEAE